MAGEIVELPQLLPQREPVDIARLYPQNFISCPRDNDKNVHDGLSIIRDTITNSTVIFDVPEDLVSSGVGVVGGGTLVFDLFEPVGFIGTCISST